MTFALILFVLLLLSAALWLADRLVFRKRRDKSAKDPWWVEWGASFFPVILVVFVLRSFIVEPYRIPSGSMIPTLLVGDFILVNKFGYGIRLPLIDKKIIAIGEPQRGDVVVFHWPVDPSTDYIKRLVGLPGDTVEYKNKRLYINEQPVPTRQLPDFEDKEKRIVTSRYEETLGKVRHQILVEAEEPPYVRQIINYPYRDNCTYTVLGFRCTVPPGHYFMMGDNRDNSMDSRVWGFVSDDLLVGRAFYIWFNLNALSRIGSFS